jgi:small conductance mechanosensitive channel
MNNVNKYWDAFTHPLEATVLQLISFVPRAFIAALLMLVFYGLAVLIRKLMKKSLARLPRIPGSIRLLMARTSYLLTLLVGLMVALSSANVSVSALVTSLGVAGFALGFALKDILENFIAGILLLFARPFEIGDQIKVADFQGTVADIQLRTTTLITYQGESVAIPNSQVYTNALVNLTALGKRRYELAFDTSLTADAGLVERLSLGIVDENPDILKNPSPFLRMSSVDSGNDCLSWKLYFWAAPTRAAELKTISQTLNQVKARLFDAGVPTPTSTSATILRRGQPETAQTLERAASPNGQP